MRARLSLPALARMPDSFAQLVANHAVQPIVPLLHCCRVLT